MAAQRTFNQANGRGNLRELATDRPHGACIFAMHEAEQLCRGELIEVAAGGKALFSWQVVIPHTSHIPMIS